MSVRRCPRFVGLGATIDYAGNVLLPGEGSMDAAQVLTFWFDTLEPGDWFGRSDDVDAQIRRQSGWRGWRAIRLAVFS